MIPSNYFWINIIFLAIGTFTIRFSIIAMSHRLRIDHRVKELFSFIPAAILPAFLAPSVVLHQGTVAWMAGKERLIILLAAMVVTFITRSTLLTIIFGLVALLAVTTF